MHIYPGNQPKPLRAKKWSLAMGWRFCPVVLYDHRWSPNISKNNHGTSSKLMHWYFAASQRNPSPQILIHWIPCGFQWISRIPGTLWGIPSPAQPWPTPASPASSASCWAGPKAWGSGAAPVPRRGRWDKRGSKAPWTSYIQIIQIIQRCWWW